MKIADLIAGKVDGERVSIEGCSAPVSSLKRLMKAGYENILVYRQTRTFSIWGKDCTACFSEEQMEHPDGSTGTS
jgi:hypothetical protein